MRELKARGPRMDVVFYLLDVMQLFRGMSLQEIQEITFEIILQGQYRLDFNDAQDTHVLRSLPGKTLSALELVCIIYVGSRGSSRDGYRGGSGRGVGDGGRGLSAANVDSCISRAGRNQD